MIDYKAIEQLIKTLSESTLTDLEIEDQGTIIKMSKEQNVIVNNYSDVRKEELLDYKAQTQEIEQKQVQQEIKQQEIKQQVTQESQEQQENIIPDKNIEIIKSPIVGTFYESPGVDQQPFAKVGSKVSKGDVLCIVEAMKLMNEITSEVDGEVIEVLVKNEDMVEYGQEIFKIRKDN